MHDAAEAWVRLILKHKRMVKLFTILFTLLEQNASLEALTALKQNMAEEINRIAQFLGTTLAFPSVEAAAEFVSAQSSLVLGAYPMIHLTPKQKEAMQAVGMDTSPEFYREKLVHSIELLLRGLTDS
jgi:hypothetical protein